MRFSRLVIFTILFCGCANSSNTMQRLRVYNDNGELLKTYYNENFWRKNDSWYWRDNDNIYHCITNFPCQLDEIQKENNE